MRALAALVVLLAGLCVTAQTAPPVPAAAVPATADCHASNVIIGLPVLHGKPTIRARATVTCTSPPWTYHARLIIQQHVLAAGHWRWAGKKVGGLHTARPVPQRRYNLPLACQAGDFRAELIVGGKPARGALPETHRFYSVPLIVHRRDCGAQHPGSG